MTKLYPDIIFQANALSEINLYRKPVKIFNKKL